MVTPPSVCTPGVECVVSLPLAIEFAKEDLALAANGEIKVGAGTVVKGRTPNGLAAIGNVGSGNTEVLPKARVGQISSEGPVLVRSGARVGGDIRSIAGVWTQPDAVVSGRTEQLPSLGPWHHTVRTVSFPVSASNHVTAKPGSVVPLAPGSYGKVSVTPGATLAVRAGTYTFEELDVGPTAVVSIDNSAGPVLLDVRVALALRGAVAPMDKDRSNVLVTFAGSGAVHIAAPIRAALLAPHASVKIAASTGTFTGALAAHDVHLADGLSFEHEPFYDERCEADGKCFPKLPKPPRDHGTGSRYLGWNSPIRWPDLPRVVANAAMAAEGCRVAREGCEAANDSCAEGVPVKGYTCTDTASACIHAKLACAEVHHASAPPGFTVATDPVQHLLASEEVRSLLGTMPGRDFLRFESFTAGATGSLVEYRQFVAISIGGEISVVPVLDGGLTIQTTSDARLSSLVSHVVPELSIPAMQALLSADQAIEAALDFLVLNDLPFPAALPVAEDATLVAVRMPRGAAGETQDRLVYSLGLSRPDTSALGWISLWIDAQSGAVLRSEKPSSANFADAIGFADGMMESTSALAAGLNYALCLFNDGTGLDRFGISRKFATSYFSTPDLSWGTASCGKGPPDFIATNDVVTFTPAAVSAPSTIDPFVDPKKIYMSPTNEFADKSAVDSQFWGQRLIAFFHERGIDHRKSPPQQQGIDCLLADGFQVRMRYLGMPDVTGNDPEGEKVTNLAAWLPPSMLKATFCSLDRFNGLSIFGKGDDQNYRTQTEPGYVAHEFFHSVIWDHVEAGGTKLPAVPSSIKDYGEIREGLAHCFAMLFTQEHIDTITQGGAQPLNGHPFHLYRSSVKPASWVADGRVNLENPRSSAPDPHKAWLGDRHAEEPKDVDEHRNATLVAGPCKLLVSGSDNPDAVISKFTVTPQHVSPVSMSLGANANPPTTADEAVAFERLKEVLLDTVMNRLSAPTLDFHTLIDAMATSAEQLGATAWKYDNDASVAYGERVRRAFSVYGFGRGKEGEPGNSAQSVDVEKNKPNNYNAARNLIAVHWDDSRPIRGDVGQEHNPNSEPVTGCFGGSCGTDQEDCKFDEDFFVLNERVRPGDKIHFEIEMDGNPGAPPRFRVRLFWRTPCEGFLDFKTSPPANDPTFKCRQANQLYPPVVEKENLDQAAPPSDYVTVPADAASYELGQFAYIGVTPILSVGCGSYVLRVRVQRRDPKPY